MLFEAAADASKRFMYQVFNQNMSQNTFPYTAPGPGPHEMFLSWGGELPLRGAINIQQEVPGLHVSPHYLGPIIVTREMVPDWRLGLHLGLAPSAVPGSSFTGNTKEVQAPQHGSLQDPALGLGTQFLENPDGRSVGPD